MFYVKVKFSHSFHFETNQSKTIEDVSTGIITEVRSRTDRFLAVFDWMSFMTTFFIFFMLLRLNLRRHFDNLQLEFFGKSKHFPGFCIIGTDG